MEIQGVKAGEIFVSSWGYDQTNVDFYKVLEDAPYGKFAKLKSLGNKFVKFNESGMCGSVVPNLEIECGEVIKKKVLGQKYGKPAFKVRSCSYAYPWSGNPQHNSWYA
jgi:hypothetical protein